jgi:hypothetical protein
MVSMLEDRAIKGKDFQRIPRPSRNVVRETRKGKAERKGWPPAGSDESVRNFDGAFPLVFCGERAQNAFEYS